MPLLCDLSQITTTVRQALVIEPVIDYRPTRKLEDLRQQQQQKQQQQQQNNRHFEKASISASADHQTTTASSTNSLLPMVDVKRHRYPYCVVWTSIPGLTWLFPFLGHVGICLSNGVITDFSGPYSVTEDQMAFGNPRKYWQLDPSRAQGGQVGWDEAVTRAAEVYRGRMHNLICDNCHSHVATALNHCAYDGKSNWTMVSVWFRLILHSRYISYWEVVRTYLPFIVIVTLITVLAITC